MGRGVGGAGWPGGSGLALAHRPWWCGPEGPRGHLPVYQSSGNMYGAGAWSPSSSPFLGSGTRVGRWRLGLASSKRCPGNNARVQGMVGSQTPTARAAAQGRPPGEPGTMSHKLVPCACLHCNCSSWCGAPKQEAQGDPGERKALGLATLCRARPLLLNTEALPGSLGPHSRDCRAHAGHMPGCEDSRACTPHARFCPPGLWPQLAWKPRKGAEVVGVGVRERRWPGTRGGPDTALSITRADTRPQVSAPATSDLCVPSQERKHPRHTGPFLSATRHAPPPPG